MLNTKNILKYRNIWMAIAIIGIIIYHMNPISQRASIQELQSVLYGGTDIFIFASGIGCYFSFSKSGSNIVFLKKRMSKLLPMYFFALLFYVIGSIGGGITIPQIIGNVMSYSYTAGLDHCFSWYISFLWIAYILVPFLYEYITSSNSRVKTYIVLVVVALLVGVSFIGNDRMIVAMSRMPIFVIGICLGNYFEEHDTISVVQAVAGIIMMLAGSVVLIKLLRTYPDISWKYGFYWFPFIVITPGLCFVISMVCFYLSKVKVMEMTIKSIGKVIGDNTLSLFLADTVTPYVCAIIGYQWDTIEFYNMSKILIVPTAVVIALFGKLIDYIFKAGKKSEAK